MKFWKFHTCPPVEVPILAWDPEREGPEDAVVIELDRETYDPSLGQGCNQPPVYIDFKGIRTHVLDLAWRKI